MSGISIQCPELAATIAKLKAFGAECPNAVVRGVRSFTEQVATEAKENRVPVDLGALRSTVHAAEVEISSGIVTGQIGAGGPTGPDYEGEPEDVGYAAIVHENVRAGHTGGVSPSGVKYKHWAKTGGPKYLENPLREALPLLDQTIGMEIDKEAQKVKA